MYGLMALFLSAFMFLIPTELVAQVKTTSSSQGLNAELLEAAASGDIRLAKELLGKGASVETKNEAGATPLMWAALGGHSDMVNFLLDNGADINAMTSNGATALKGAAAAGKLQVVKLLIESGADTSIKDRDGINALQAAQEAGQREVADFIGSKMPRPAGSKTAISVPAPLETAFVAKSDDPKGVAVHSASSGDSQIIAFLPVGSIIRHEGVGEKGWLLINAPIINGWILEAYLKAGKPQATITKTDSGSGCLKVRKGPGPKNDEVGCLKPSQSPVSYTHLRRRRCLTYT